MKKLVIALAVLFVAAQALQADGCRRVQTFHHQQAYAVHQTYAVTQFLQVPVAVYPVYGVGYGAGEEIRQLKEELSLIRRAIVQQPDPPEPQRKQAQKEPKGAKLAPSAFQNPKLVAYVKAECSKCHSETGRQDKGLALLTADGVLAEPGELMRLKAFREVSTGNMPKGGKAPDDEVLALFAEWAGK